MDNLLGNMLIKIYGPNPRGRKNLHFTLQMWDWLYPYAKQEIHKHPLEVRLAISLYGVARNSCSSGPFNDGY